MAIVTSSIEIKGALEDVYSLAKQIEAFPEFMPDVKSVKILEKSEDGCRTVSEWVGIVKEFKTTLKWVEEDIWNDTDHTCTFSLVKGDYGKYSGEWKFTDIGGATRWDSVIDFEYDIPLIGPLIKGIIVNKMRENVENMLAALKRKIEGEG